MRSEGTCHLVAVKNSLPPECTPLVESWQNNVGVVPVADLVSSTHSSPRRRRCCAHRAFPKSALCPRERHPGALRSTKTLLLVYKNMCLELPAFPPWFVL